MRLKAVSYFFSPLSFVKLCSHMCCVLHSSEVLGLSRPDGLIMQASGHAALSSNEICQPDTYITEMGARGRWCAKKWLSRVKCGRAGFGDQHNLEWSAFLPGVASYWRSRQLQPPCLDRMGVSRILMRPEIKRKRRSKERNVVKDKTE